MDKDSKKGTNFKILDNINEVDEEMIYKRNIKSSYEALKGSKVCILGAGGLGSNVAVNLARCGVGHIYICDFDIVEASNLNRQYYRLSHIGKKKVYAIKEVIEEINPFIDVKICDKRINKDNLHEIIKEYPVVCEALDEASVKSMVINEILSNYTDKVVVSASGMAGIDTPNEIKTTKKINNLYICGDEKSDMEEIDGMMAPRVSVCAGHQANMILRILLNKE